MNSYLALYAHQAVGLTTRDAGFVLGVLGIAGGVSRVLWSGLGQRMRHSSHALVIVSVAAAGCALVVGLAARGGSFLLWIGAAGLGASAVAAFALSMVVLLLDRGPEGAGHDAALVSIGVFSGFAVGAPMFGALVDATGGYGAGWVSVAAEFAAGGAVALLWQRSQAGERAVPPPTATANGRSC